MALIAPDHTDPVAAAQFRWLAGHQLTFFVWRLLAEALDALINGSPAAARTVGTAATLFDTYSVLLLYCGSCSPEIYADVIRPQMILADPAFNGRWARDFEPIGPMMRTLRSTTVPESLDELFRAAVENDRIHQAVAIRLVPGGQSLLRSSGRDRDLQPTDEERDIYDAFFEVGLERPSRDESIAQLQQRLSTVRSDLTAHPLPVPCGWEGLGIREVALVDRFHRDSIAILDDLEKRVDEFS